MKYLTRHRLRLTVVALKFFQRPFLGWPRRRGPVPQPTGLFRNPGPFKAWARSPVSAFRSRLIPWPGWDVPGYRYPNFRFRPVRAPSFLLNTIKSFLEPPLPFLACFLQLVPSLLSSMPPLLRFLPTFLPHEPVWYLHWRIEHLGTRTHLTNQVRYFPTVLWLILFSRVSYRPNC